MSVLRAGVVQCGQRWYPQMTTCRATDSAVKEARDPRATEPAKHRALEIGLISIAKCSRFSWVLETRVFVEPAFTTVLGPCASLLQHPPMHTLCPSLHNFAHPRPALHPPGSLFHLASTSVKHQSDRLLKEQLVNTSKLGIDRDCLKGGRLTDCFPFLCPPLPPPGTRAPVTSSSTLVSLTMPPSAKD